MERSLDAVSGARMLCLAPCSQWHRLQELHQHLRNCTIYKEKELKGVGTVMGTWLPWNGTWWICLKVTDRYLFRRKTWKKQHIRNWKQCWLKYLSGALAKLVLGLSPKRDSWVLVSIEHPFLSICPRGRLEESLRAAPWKGGTPSLVKWALPPDTLPLSTTFSATSVRA